MRGRIKKLISALCTVAMVFSIVVVPNMVSFAQTPDGVSTRVADQDVIVSVTDNAVNNTVDGIEADLKDTINASGVSSRTRVSTTDIDVTDLSKWYVYDRYDTTFAKDESTYLQKTGYNKALRPYYGVSESYNGVTGFSTGNTKKFSSRSSTSNLYTSIPDILEADRVGLYHDDPSNMESDGTTMIMPMDITSDEVVNAIAQYDNGKSAGEKLADVHPDYQKASHYVYPLKEHIYAYQQDGKANMFFYGYGKCGGQVSGFDFLYYPALPNGTKKVDYTVDASNLTVHSLGDSGFFFNCGIKKEKKSGYGGTTYVDKLYGYYLGFTYKGSTSSNPARTPITSFDKAYLYKLNGVEVDTLHKTLMSKKQDDGTFKLFGSDSTNISKVDEISLASCDVSDYLLSDIALEITSTSLKAKMTAHNDSTKSVELFNKTGLSATGYGGFGPAVEWGVASHSCAVTSTFEFSDLKMKIIESESVLNGFCYADFTQKINEDADAKSSTKYFVLIGDTKDKTKDYYKIEADRAYLELLKKEHVILITNLPIEPDTIGMGGTDYSLKSYLGDNNVFQISGETDQDYADAIAEIVQTHKSYDTSGKYTDETGATFDVLDAANGKTIDEVSGTNCYLTVGGTQLSAINTTFIGNSVITADVVDDYSINVMSGTTKKIKYILTAGDGTQEEITWGTSAGTNKYLKYDSTNKKPYIDIDKNSAVGDYTLTLVGVAGDNDNAILSTTGFSVGAFYDSTLNGEPYADGADDDHVSAIPSSQYNDIGKYAVTAGKEYKLMIVTDTGFDFAATDECVVTVNGVTLTPGTDYTLTKPDNKTRIISIPSDKVNGDVSVTTSTETLEYEADVSWADSTEDVERKDGKDLHEAPITAEQDYVVKVGIKEANKKERALADTVTVKVGDVEVKAGIGRYVYDPKAGTVTVKKAIIGGNIKVIVGSKVRTEFDVIPDVTNVSFDGEDVATVGTDYEATITPNTGYDNPTTITVTVDGNPLEPGVGYTYVPDTGVIVINGNAIGYDVKITAVGTPKTYGVTKTPTNCTIDGNDTATYLTDYTAIVVANTHYTLPTSVTVKVGGTALATDKFTYDPSTGALTIAGESITGDVEIIAAGVPEQYTHSIGGTNIVPDSSPTGTKDVDYNVDAEFTIVAEDYYELTDEIEVKVGGETLDNTSETQYTFNKTTGELKILAAYVTGNVEVIASASPKQFGVTNTVSNATYDGGATASYNTDYEETIVADSYYHLPETITVKVGNDTLDAGTDYTYDSTTGEVSVLGTKITADMVITVTAKPDTFGYSIGGDNVVAETSTPDTMVPYGTDKEFTVTPEYGYKLPDSITVTVDGAELEKGTDYTYDPDTKKVKITGTKITGEIVITANAIPTEYNVTNTVSHATYDGEDSAKYNTNYEEQIVADSYYHLPDTITVKVGNDTLEAGTDYTYDSTTGNISVLGSKLIDDVVITVTAKPDTFNFDIGGDHVVSQTSDNDPDKMVPYDTDKKFTIVPETGYLLTDDITVKVGSEDITDYTFDKDSGELIIPGTKITGDIKVVATTIPKKYDVTNTVTNMTVTGGSDKASHGEKYSETLVPNTGYDLPDTIKVMVDGTELANDKFTYDKTTGELEILDSAVTGPIEILADGVQIKYPYSVEGKGIVPITSSDTEYATYGTNQVFELELLDGYLFPNNVEVKIGNTVLDPTEYTYDQTTGKITIPGDKIIDKISVVANAIPKEMDVTYDLGNITYDGPDKCEYGKEYKTKLTPGENYDLPDDIVVKVGEKILIPGKDYSYDPKTGELIIFADNVTGKIKIEAAATPKKFDVVNDITNGKADGDVIATYKKDYKENITPSDDYDFPSYVVVTVGGKELEAGVDYAYTSINGELVILGEKITGKVVVKAAADKITYKVKDDISNGKFIGDKKVEKGKDYKATIKPADGYELPDSITVKVDGKTLTPGVDYTYNPKTGEIVILNKNISGTIEIIADNVKIKEKSKAENNIDLNAKLKVSQVKKQVNVSWGKVDGADLYEVYVTYCGNKYPKKPSFKTEKNTTTNVVIKKIDGKKLNLKKNYKLFIKVYKYDEDGDKILIAESIKVHFVGRLNTAYTNVKQVKTDKSKYSLKKGQTVQIKAKNVLVSPKKKQLSDAHAKEFRYASSDSKIASVNKKGVIKAKKAGKCYVYVYARNGFAKKIQVTVK